MDNALIGLSIPVVCDSDPEGYKTKEGETSVSNNGKSLPADISADYVVFKSVKVTINDCHVVG